MKPFVRQNKWLLGFTLLFGAVASAASVLIALVLQKIIDAALQGDWKLFWQIMLISVVYLLLLGLLDFAYSVCSKALIRNLTIFLRERVYRGVFARDASAYSAANSADYLSALTNDIKLLEENYMRPALDTLQHLIVFVFSLIVLLYLSPLVTGILLASMVLMFVVPSLFGQALQEKQSAVSTQLSRFTIRLKDLLGGYEVIQSYALNQHAEREFREQNTRAAKVKFAADRLVALSESVSHTLAILTQFSVVFIAAYLILTGRLSAGSLVALVQLSGGFVGPVLGIMQNVPKIKGVKPVLERIGALAAEADSPESEQLPPAFNRSLEARQLQFAYRPEQPVISEINLELKKGGKYALVGPSGCGKSTLVKLLTGYYRPGEGSVLLDGNDADALGRDRLRRLAAVIHQNVYMFDADIRHNICLYEDFSEEALEGALKMSGIGKFLPSLPAGLLSPVGENGSLLSGGQRQRIAVARALIRNKPLLVLDEATSAIDMQTAYESESRLLSLDGLTLITITHNMSENLLGLYDEIIYMEEGRIAERGPLTELLEREGKFARFYTLEREQQLNTDPAASTVAL